MAGYVLRRLGNNGGFGTGVMGANPGCQNDGASMSSTNCQWLRGGQQVDDRAYSGGNSSTRGGRAAFGSSRRRPRNTGPSRPSRSQLSPVYNLLSLSRSFFLVFLWTSFHKGGNRVCISASRM